MAPIVPEVLYSDYTANINVGIHTRVKSRRRAELTCGSTQTLREYQSTTHHLSPVTHDALLSLRDRERESLDGFPLINKPADEREIDLERCH